MEIFDKIGQKASEAYKVTADKTGKIAKEAKLKIKMNDLKSQISVIYKEIGAKVYEKHSLNEPVDINEDLVEECNRIDELSNEIEKYLSESLELRDKRKCNSCYKEIDLDVKYCPYCGNKQEIVQIVKEDDSSSDSKDEEDEEDEVDNDENQVEE